MSIYRFNEAFPRSTDRGTIRREQTMLLVGLASGQRDVGTHALEFGTLYGTTTTNIARAMPKHHVLTCSLPPGVIPLLSSTKSELEFYPKEAPVFPEDVRNRITHYQCDSADLYLDFKVKLGFIFIDGGHSYEYVWNDFKKAVPRMVRGSVVVFDDYGEDGRGGITGVKRAVDEIVAAYSDWEWTEWVGSTMVWGRVGL